MRRWLLLLAFLLPGAVPVLAQQPEEPQGEEEAPAFQAGPPAPALLGAHVKWLTR